MHAISWNMYWVATAATVVSYYLIIYWLFFRGGKGSRRSKRGNKVAGPSAEGPGHPMGPEAMLQSQLHDMVDELSAFIRQAGKHKVGKAELIAGVQKITEKYPLVKESAFREGIQNLIAVTVEDHCACRLSADELRMVWDGGEA